MRTTELSLQTGDRRFTDITGEVRGFAREVGGDGLLHVFLPHATAGLALFETGAGSEGDLSDAIERLLPREDRYEHAHGSPGHGADHLLPAFVTPFLVLAVERGDVVLGTWQSIVLVDTNRDNPDRRVRLTFLEG